MVINNGPFSLDKLEDIYISNYEDVPNKKLLNLNVELLNNFKGFRDYLSGVDFDYYELSTMLFAQIKSYLEECLNKKNTKEIEVMFNYIGKLEDKKDDEVSNVIYLGLLEIISKDFFDLIWMYIPSNIKTQIFTYHNEYIFRQENIGYLGK